MTLDRQNKNPNLRTSNTSTASKWTGRGTPTPSHVRSPTSSTTPRLRSDVHETSQTVSGADAREEVVTPGRTFLSSNVTPRSGSRKARVESASSTPRRSPDNTTSPGRPVSMIEGRDWPSRTSARAPGSGLRAGHMSRSGRAQSVSSDVQYPEPLSSANNTQIRGSRPASPDSLPQFFHANDAKPRLNARAQSRSPQLQPKSAGAPYINGTSKVDTSVLTASPGSGDEHLRFCYADRIPEATSPPPRFANGIVSARPPLQTIFSSYQTTTSPAQRPPSPLKEEVLPVSRKSSLSKPSPRRHTRLVSNGSNDIRAPEALVKGHADLSRRSSLNSRERRISQPQSPITTSFGFAPSRRSSIALSDSGPDASPTTLLRSAPAEPPPAEPTMSTSLEPVPPQNASKPAPGESRIDHLNDLAANARRERKVLDLEISNSSLLAINRTLETEMRRQKTELRQLRRLRSSSRFPSSTRSASSRFSIPSTNDEISPTSSADEDGMDDDRFSDASDGTSDDTSFPDSSSFSPTVRNSSIPVAKGRQSRSFKVDMAGQRVLLLESQRLNQALKRCMSRTDELIADGRKALEYKVNTGDAMKLGPRVLTADERDGEMEPSRGLLSPGLDERIENPWDQVRSSEGTFNLPEPDNLEEQRIELPPNPWGAEGDDEPGAQMQALHGPFSDGIEKELGLGIVNTGEDADETESTLEERHQNMADGNSSIEADATTPIHASLLQEPLVSKTEDIPYEDPGIDTGGETSTMEDDDREDTQAPDRNERENMTDSPPLTVNTDNASYGVSMDTSQVESSDNDSIISMEPTVSSPGKGLGGFLRMVGGSWGV